MKADKNHSIAKILTIIPVILATIPLFSLFIAMVLEGPTKRGTLYTIFMLIVMLGLFLAPPISIILSIIAIVLVIKAIKDGDTKPLWILILGVIELVLSSGGIIFAILFIVAGKGV